MDTRKKVSLFMGPCVCQTNNVAYIGVPAGIRHFCTVEKTSFKNAGK
ncbi:conserved protein of unknown function [Streptococcus thermophilus]|nr:conserved protein of unknown function [Streptococcus thermophilus]